MEEENNNFWLPLDHALEMAFAFDRNGIIIYANIEAKEHLGYGDALKGTNINDIFPNDFEKNGSGFQTDFDMDSDITRMFAYRQNRTCFHVEVRFIRVWEEPVRYLCVANDISKEEMLQKEIERVTKETEEMLQVKSQFVANVTHELRTPVNGILGNTREMLSHEDDKNKRAVMELVVRTCQDMNQIINNILDFSKLDAGKFVLDPTKFCIRNMVDYVKANHINKITEKGVEFFVTVSPEVPENIIADELRIVQILNNLLSNACKFTSVGKITLEILKTAQVGNMAELFFLVIDTGIGMDKTDQEKLFKSFSQVDASISRKYGGTGLGLNISKQLVELMGGSISVESEKNKGSVFSVSIWVEIPEDELSGEGRIVDKAQAMAEVQNFYREQGEDRMDQFGTPENLEELRKKMSKLILSVEMSNWEKAEQFAEMIKEMTQGAPKDVKNVVLRLRMAVQKGDCDKTDAAFKKLKELL